MVLSSEKIFPFESKTLLLSMVPLVFQISFRRSGNNIYWLLSPSHHYSKKLTGWNFHFQLAEYVCDTFVSSPFHLSCNNAADFCFHTSWRLCQKPYIKKCHLVFHPKATCTNVQPSFIFHFHWSAVKRLARKVWRGGSIRTSWHTWSIRFGPSFVFQFIVLTVMWFLFQIILNWSLINFSICKFVVNALIKGIRILDYKSLTKNTTSKKMKH